MKVTPMAGGSGTPGNTLGQVDTGRSTSQSKINNAKRAFNGEAPGTITETHEEIDPQASRLKKRRLVMKTNANPEAYLNQNVPRETLEPAEPATIDTHETAQGTEVTKPLSPEFAALARQRRELQKREQAFQVKEREMAQQLESLKAGQTTSGIDLTQVKADPLGVLTKAGVSYDDLTQAILNGPKQPSIDAEALKADLLASIKQELSQNFEARDTQAEQDVLSQIKREAQSLVEQGEEFELVRATKSLPDAIELIHRTWKKTGEVLDTEEALRLVEQDLEEQMLPIAQSKKIQMRMRSSEAAAPQQQMRTLTSRDSAPIPTTAKQRAIAAFYGNLKK